MSEKPPVLHLVLGDSSASELRKAVRTFRLPRGVHCIPDDLGHGPLHDGRARMAHMRACFVGGFDWRNTRRTDAFAAWDDLVDKLKVRPRHVVVWAGSNVSETVLLAMACWKLDGVCEKLSRVAPPDGRHGASHVGTWRADQLAGFYPARRLVSTKERRSLAGEFDRWRKTRSLRRAWVDDRIKSVPISAFDELVMAHVEAQWQMAARIVGNVMGHSNPRDGLSDVFISSRLQALIADGRIEADRRPRRLREYRVRLTQAS